MVFKQWLISAAAHAQFENDVKMYGIQTNVYGKDGTILFENDVKMYGIQTTVLQIYGYLSLRMM